MSVTRSGELCSMSLYGSQTTANRFTPGIPQDLAEWMGAVRLIQATSDAVRVVQLPEGTDRTESGSDPSSMLALFAYGLARGIQDSQELEARAANEPGLKHLCSGARPSATALRNFRRRHASDIQTALTRVLGACWQDCEGAEEMQPALQAEAESRIRSSIWADSVNLDH